MKEELTTSVRDKDEEISSLIHQLIGTEQRLLELTPEVDAILDPGGRSYLMRQAQEKLRERDATQSAILNALPANITLVDSKGVILQVNEGWRRFAGANALEDKASGVGQNYLEVCDRSRNDHSKEAHEVATGIRSVLNGSAKNFDMDYPCHSPAEQRWFRLLVAPLETGSAGAVVMHVNITEQKRTEERFRRLVDSNAQGVFFWNLKGDITEGNDAFLKLVGYSRDDMQAGRINWATMTPPEYTKLDQHALMELGATGVCTPFEKEWICKDGSRVPILLGAAMFEDKPDEGVCFVFDLSERKKLEKQVLRAQRMDSIGTLAGGIAHDLNNCLAPIILSVDLLTNLCRDPDSQELLEIVASSALRGSNMVRQVLTFARGVEGERTELQIRHLVEDIEKIVRDTFVKRIDVRTDVPHDLWTVLGDATQLHQVLMNLCLNARDAMPKGGKLHVSAQNITLDAHNASLNAEADPGPYIVIRVEDSGTGIPPEIVEKIFDPFFTTKEVGKGTGLGLSTSLGIIKNHGGFVRVYSEPQRGTTFEVYLHAEADLSSPAEIKKEIELPRGHGELILVVDDESSVRVMAQRILEQFGYRTISASDGAEATEVYAARGYEISIVLIDMNMPVMDGPETVRNLWKLNREVRIIATSGRLGKSQLEELTAFGVRDFLAKPYTLTTLLKTMKLTVEGKVQGPESGA